MSDRMMDTTPVPPHDPAQGGSAGHAPMSADERIAFRGPIQRLLVSPEIGAIIGAIMVWAFFWGNGRTFGTAATTLIVLDAAAPLGIMAVVVALLMIGGEFDLSAGVMTGATGILVGLMVKYFQGNGAPLWLAILAAFVLAGTIGFFNGTLVNRTGLPSFIVTLSTFFVIKGVTLVLAKRLEHKVSVTGVDSADGFKPFYRFFAYDYKPKNFEGRDVLFTTLIVVGITLLSIGLLEQSFIRRAVLQLKTVPLGVLGLIAAAAGFVGLHHTDGVSNNALWGIVGGVGVILVFIGFGTARYETRGQGTDGGAGVASPRSVPARVRNLVLAGVAGVTLACLAPLVLKRNERREILKWFPSDVRVIVAIIAAATGVAIAVRQYWPRLRERFTWYLPIQTVLFAAVVGSLFLAGTLSFLQLTTIQALRAIAMMALSGTGLALLLRARAQAGQVGRTLQLMVGMISVLAVVVLAFVVRNDSGAVRFRSGLFGALLLGAVILAANTVLETGLLKRHEANVKSDRLGRRLVVVGAFLAVVGLAIRIVFTNLASGSTAKGTGFSITRMSIVWWLVATLIGSFVLTKTKWGNWIFAVGGNKEAARAIGVPANKVKTGLFVAVSMMGAFVGIMLLLRFTSVQASQGDGQEFQFIIAAVVGGNLLTGGYGSVIGASVGALILAMSDNGIGSAGWNQDGRFAFKGAVLLVAVLVNNFVRKKAQEAR